MTYLRKILFFLEIIICFGSAFYSVVIGLILVLAFAPSYFSRTFPDVEIGALLVLVMLVGGILGMVAVVSLIIKVLKPSARVISPSKIKVFALCGILSVLGSIGMSVWSVTTFSSDISWKEFIYSIGWRYIFSLLPVAGVIHLAYLNRDYLFETSANKELNST